MPRTDSKAMKNFHRMWKNNTEIETDGYLGLNNVKFELRENVSQELYEMVALGAFLDREEISIGEDYMTEAEKIAYLDDFMFNGAEAAHQESAMDMGQSRLDTLYTMNELVSRNPEFEGAAYYLKVATEGIVKKIYADNAGLGIGNNSLEKFELLETLEDLSADPRFADRMDLDPAIIAKKNAALQAGRIHLVAESAREALAKAEKENKPLDQKEKERYLKQIAMSEMFASMEKQELAEIDKRAEAEINKWQIQRIMSMRQPEKLRM